MEASSKLARILAGAAVFGAGAVFGVALATSTADHSAVLAALTACCGICPSRTPQWSLGVRESERDAGPFPCQEP
jgi:hypothetical protein